MVWIGVVIGLLVGAIAQSADVAAVGALVGAMLGNVVGRRVHRSRPVAESPVPSDTQAVGTPVAQGQPFPVSTSSDDAGALRAEIDLLKRRVLALESKMGVVSTIPETPSPFTTVAARPVEAIPVAMAPRASERIPSQPFVQTPHAWEDQVEKLRRVVFGGNAMVKIGVLLLFLGLAFLLRYAQAQFSLPLGARYGVVGLAALVLLALGWRLRARQDWYGMILQGAGVAVLYLATLAAMKLHALIGPAVAFPVLVLVAAGGVGLAVVQNARVLAIVATLGGFAAPILCATGTDNHIALFSYIAVLDLAIAAVAWRRAWRELNMVGFVCTTALGWSWGLFAYEEAFFVSAQAFLIGFFLLFVVIGALFTRGSMRDALARPHGGGRATPLAIARLGVDASLTIGAPCVAFVLQCMLLAGPGHRSSAIAAAFGVFYVFVAGLAARLGAGRYRLLAETYLVIALLFGTLALAFGLDRNGWSGAWMLEAAALYWLASRTLRHYGQWAALALFAAGAGLFLLTLRLGSQTPLLGSTSSACLFTIAAAAIAWMAHRPGIERHEPGLAETMTTLALAGAVITACVSVSWPWMVIALCLIGAVAMGGASWVGSAVASMGGALILAVAAIVHLGDFSLLDSGTDIYSLVAVLVSVATGAACLRGRAGTPFESAWSSTALGVALFSLVTAIVLRVCHYGAGVVWNLPGLWRSILVQVSLSVVWSVLALALMVFAHRSARRSVWIVGATLIALVVIKLFTVELGDSGGLSRIVSFIAVGGLLLVVGYFAPVPPRRMSPAPGADGESVT